MKTVINKQENQFYGKRELLSLFQMKSKGSITSYLDRASKEVSTKADRELLHTIGFSAGDVVNRQHLAFEGAEVDKGGESAVNQWMEYVKWLLKNDLDQAVAFLPLMVEYVGWREILSYQFKKDGEWGLLKDFMDKPKAYKALKVLLVQHLNNDDWFRQSLVFKFLHIPRYSSKQKINKEGKKTKERRAVTDRVRKKMDYYKTLLDDLSEMMGWDVIVGNKYTNFSGFKAAKREFQDNIVSYLFSTKKVKELDEQQYKTWIDNLPGNARFKVRRMLFDKDDNLRNPEWEQLYAWHKQYEEYKEFKQQEKRTLEEKAKTVGLTAKEEKKLVKVTKQAKSNSGALTIIDAVQGLLTKKTDALTLDTIVNNTVFEVPVFLICDISGSMTGYPNEISKILLTLALLKNPRRENLFMRFGSESEVIYDNAYLNVSRNRFIRGNGTNVGVLIDRKVDFMTNYQKISSILSANSGMTNVSSIPTALKRWVDAGENEMEKAHRKECIQEYPVFMILSDGDFNNGYSSASSLQDCMMKMRQWFGWDGVFVIWDIPRSGLNQQVSKAHYFDNLENVVHITSSNASTINQIFTRLHDLDIVDIYTPLKSLYASNRYDLVREAVL